MGNRLIKSTGPRGQPEVVAMDGKTAADEADKADDEGSKGGGKTDESLLGSLGQFLEESSVHGSKNSVDRSRGRSVRHVLS